MESRKGNNKRLFERFYQWSLSISESDLSSPFPNKAKLRLLNFGWPLNRDKDNKKPSL